MLINNFTKNNLENGLPSEGWIQPSINQSYVPVSNERIVNDIYSATPDEKIVVLNANTQSWFLTQEWQKLEAQAEEDIAEGRFTSHNNMDDFIADLDN